MGQKISLDAAADELTVSKCSIRRLISSGQLRAFRVGNANIIRVDRDDLDALLCALSCRTASRNPTTNHK